MVLRPARPAGLLDTWPGTATLRRVTATYPTHWLRDAGELDFSWLGVSYQLAAIALESVRLTMTQLLLQGHGVKLNPITTLYFVAPACFVGLVPLFFAFEFHQLRADTEHHATVAHLVANSATAFGAAPAAAAWLSGVRDAGSALLSSEQECLPSEQADATICQRQHAWQLHRSLACAQASTAHRFCSSARRLRSQ